MLNCSGHTKGDTDLRTNRKTGLPNLVIERDCSGVNHRAGASYRRPDFIRELLHERKVIVFQRSSSSDDNNLGREDAVCGFFLRKDLTTSTWETGAWMSSI